MVALVWGYSLNRDGCGCSVDSAMQTFVCVAEFTEQPHASLSRLICIHDHVTSHLIVRRRLLICAKRQEKYVFSSLPCRIFGFFLCEMIEHDDYLLLIKESQICNFLGSGQTHLLCPTLNTRLVHVQYLSKLLTSGIPGVELWRGTFYRFE